MKISMSLGIERGYVKMNARNCSTNVHHFNILVYQKDTIQHEKV
jgi:hypothetical protein